MIFLYFLLAGLLIWLAVLFPWMWIVAGILLVIWLISIFRQPEADIDTVGLYDEEDPLPSETPSVSKSNPDDFVIPKWLLKKK